MNPARRRATGTAAERALARRRRTSGRRRGLWRVKGRRWRPTTRQTWGRLASGRTARKRPSPNSRPCRCRHRRARSTRMTEARSGGRHRVQCTHLAVVLTGLRKNVTGCNTTERKELRKESTRASLPLAFEKIALSTMAITAAGRKDRNIPGRFMTQSHRRRKIRKAPTWRDGDSRREGDASLKCIHQRGRGVRRGKVGHSEVDAGPYKNAAPVWQADVRHRQTKQQPKQNYCRQERALCIELSLKYDNKANQILQSHNFTNSA